VAGFAPVKRMATNGAEASDNDANRRKRADHIAQCPRENYQQALIVTLAHEGLETSMCLARPFGAISFSPLRVCPACQLGSGSAVGILRSFASPDGFRKSPCHATNAPSRRVLNHAPSGVTRRHYDKYSYQDEKRAALVRWERHLLNDVIGGGKVVALWKA
jgi:hypothetical protein